MRPVASRCRCQVLKALLVVFRLPLNWEEGLESLVILQCITNVGRHTVIHLAKRGARGQSVPLWRNRLQRVFLGWTINQTSARFVVVQSSPPPPPNHQSSS